MTKITLSVSKVDENKCKNMNRSKLGRAVRGVVTRANSEKRLICGLLPAISYLEKAPEDVLICLLPQTRPGDAATHMQTVLLQAFCYENYIPVIQVDSSEKLADYCSIVSERKDKPAECECAIVTISKDGMNIPSEEDNNNLVLSPAEQTLTDFYECTLEEFPRPVIELPI